MAEKKEIENQRMLRYWTPKARWRGRHLQHWLNSSNHDAMLLFFCFLRASVSPCEAEEMWVIVEDGSIAGAI